LKTDFLGEASVFSRVFFKEKIFYTSSQVYEPAEDTFLLAENLEVRNGETVLEVGSGCGILSVIAASDARKVMSIDINPLACRLTVLNAKINGLQAELDKIVNGYTDTSGTTPIRVIGLSEMIATGDTNREDYRIRLKQVEEISKELAAAQKELSALQQTPDDISANPDILLAQIKVDTYETQIQVLRTQISQLYQQIINEEQGNGQSDLQSVYILTSAVLTRSTRL